MTERKIVLASRNKKKTQEVADLLGPAGFVVVPVTEFPGIPEVEEDGDTFALAEDFDADYVQAFREATAYGVEALAIRCKVSPEEIIARDPIPILAPHPEGMAPKLHKSLI